MTREPLPVGLDNRGRSKDEGLSMQRSLSGASRNGRAAASLAVAGGVPEGTWPRPQVLSPGFQEACTPSLGNASVAGKALAAARPEGSRCSGGLGGVRVLAGGTGGELGSTMGSNSLSVPLRRQGLLHPARASECFLPGPQSGVAARVTAEPRPPLWLLVEPRLLGRSAAAPPKL
mmetsp:Transcript_53091/g.123584  ORF Transcript_53091/g.123584 Transcript_53091/m.123584 type:complete len:175 (-) Transcript_53091:97-621(-)